MLSLLLLFQQNPDAHYGGGTASSGAVPATDLAARIFRFLLSGVPQWVQIAGIVIGGPIALYVAWRIWKSRRTIWSWFLSRSRVYKLGIVGVMGITALLVGFIGIYNYNYIMHRNDFCQSCHVMDKAWNRFQVTAHKDLQCHACHRQPLYASTKELYYWVFERTMAIPAHDKVPTAVCSECHVRAKTDSTRTNVMLTAGHVLHLKSDSSSLKNIQCVTCHGRDFHMFNPNNATCSQSGCHVNQVVKLGAMSNTRFLHCTTCHDFRGRVKEGATVADAKAAVTPKALGCTACHSMTEKVLRWDLAADPHKGSCGSCHNPHKQEQPKDAFKTCANAGCHASADTLTAFHRGLGTHALDQCGACHQAHSWKVKGTDCIACHKGINEDKPLIRRTPAPTRKPVAFNRRQPRHVVARFASFVLRPSPLARPSSLIAHRPSPADSLFLHSRHKSVPCTDCHGRSSTHGELKIKAPGSCLACHHGASQKTACSTCHVSGSVAAKPTPVTFHVSARKTDVTRTLSFTHSRHGRLECARCHGANDKRTPTVTCESCHADHHDLARDCASCHPTAKAGHDRGAHAGCATCHTPARFAVAATPARAVCTACHQEQKAHYPGRECATCHALVAQ